MYALRSRLPENAKVDTAKAEKSNSGIIRCSTPSSRPMHLRDKCFVCACVWEGGGGGGDQLLFVLSFSFWRGIQHRGYTWAEGASTSRDASCTVRKTSIVWRCFLPRGTATVYHSCVRVRGLHAGQHTHTRHQQPFMSTVITARRPAKTRTKTN